MSRKPKGVWTPEQREAQRQRTLERMAGNTSATPSTFTPTADDLLPAPTATDMIEAVDDNMIVDSQDWEEAGVDGANATLASAGLEARVEHRHHGTVTLYDPQGNARRVPRPNLRICLANGLRAECPLCKGRHRNDSPNQCPKREPLLVTECPICGKPTWEARAIEKQSKVNTSARNFVQPALPDRASREQGVQRRLNDHLMTFHPQEAYQQYGLQRGQPAGVR